jgi:hypothetical protein
MVKIDKEDSRDFTKLSYLTEMSAFYWRRTKNPDFLYEYQKNLKKLLEFKTI